ncbi:MAG: sodium-dependent bicarbonate transport family permease [Verrucomicrobia bacterium]|nr:sodium-dependent bicarbonate transport family permease [Verrucomicrobiota bacterium]
MELIVDFLRQFLSQLQSPTLSFLIGGFLIAALGSRLTIPGPIYQFVVFMLLMKIGLEGGIEIRQANLGAMLLPAFFAVLIGLLIVYVGHMIFSRLANIQAGDGTATAGLFGAVSASTLAAALVMLEEQMIGFEAWVPALYPFMDIPALILAIVLASVAREKAGGKHAKKVSGWEIVKDSLRGSALSAMLLGLVIGLLAKPESVTHSFYDPLFRGMLSILMLILGMEAWSRIRELKGVAHWFILYATIGPLLHGMLAFGLGYLAHLWVGFSPGGVVLLAVIASSNSDISGPPTIRAGIPWANPSAYIGASTSVGTPVAIAIGIPFYIALAQVVFNL